MSTGQTVLSKFWDADKNRAKAGLKNPTGADLNYFLENLSNECLNFYRRFIVDEKRAPTHPELKSHLNLIINPSDNQKTFLGYVLNLIQDRAKMPRFSEGRIKQYQRVYNHLVEFNKKRRFDFDTISPGLIEKFVDYLYSIGHESSTIKVEIKNILGTFLNAARKEKLIDSADFEGVQIFDPLSKAIKKKDIILNLNDWNKIESLELKESHLIRIRYIMQIQLYLALSFKSLQEVVKADFVHRVNQNGEVYLVLRKYRAKTKNFFEKPVHRKAAEALKAIDYNLKIAMQYYNRSIKKICEMAGVCEVVLFLTNKGGAIQENRIEKYKVISTHTLRRTAITWFVKSAGIGDAQKFAGHAKATMTQKYNKESLEEFSERVAGNEFFN